MQRTHRPFPVLRRHARHAWLAVALCILWAQFVAAVHHHADAGDAPSHRAASCDLCSAQSSPGAPPPASVPLPRQDAPAAVPAATALPHPVLRERATQHSPRAPPLSRRA